MTHFAGTGLRSDRKHTAQEAAAAAVDGFIANAGEKWNPPPARESTDFDRFEGGRGRKGVRRF